MRDRHPPIRSSSLWADACRVLPVLLLLLVPPDAGAVSIGSGDDTAIFGVASSVPPNVMILLDTSGSMGGLVGGVPKIDTSKTVLTQLVNDVNPDNPDGTYVERARFGFSRFSPSDDGAQILVGTEAGSKPAVLNAVANASAGGFTPLSEALVDVGRYFVNEHATWSYPDITNCDPGAAAGGGSTVTIPISTGTDDASYTEGDASTDLNSSILALQDSGESDPGVYAGFRWNLPVPQGATIVEAYIQLYVHNRDKVSHDIYLEQTHNASAFGTGANDLPNRVGGSFVKWNKELDDNEWWNSPSIKNLVQAIVDRPAWSSGNAVAVILAPRTVNDNQVDFRSYDYDPSFAPKLFVEYLDADPPPPGTGICDDPLDQPKFPGTPSPFDVECRQSFIISISDGEPTHDQNNHYGTAVAGTTAFSNYVDTFGNADNDSSECDALVTSCIDDPETGRDDGFFYSNEGTDWFDDVAYYLSHEDLIAVLPGDQHVITYTIGFAIDHPLLSDTADAGLGEYFTTSDSTQLANILTNIVVDIFDRSTSFTSTAVPSSRTGAEDRLYTAYFSPLSTKPFWPGHLESYTLDANGDILDDAGNLAVDPVTGIFLEPRNPHWDAGLELLSNTSRSIYTTDLSTAPASRIDFGTATISTTQLNLSAGDHTQYPNWNTGGVNLVSEVDLRDALVNYLHGQDAFDDDLDSNVTEVRSGGVLGDIFHSDPIAVGTPSVALLGEPGYGKGVNPFFAQYESRDRVVYAGANDGMLHAFAAGTYSTLTQSWSVGTGEELFGWIPGSLLDDVKWVPRNTPRTRYFVDLPPAIAEVWIGDGTGTDITKTADEWATVLLQGYRQGGRGYMALDVTDPRATSGTHGPYPKLMWEMTAAQEPKLGDSWSEPIITRVKRAGPSMIGDHCGLDDGDGDCVETWVAIFGSGYELGGNPNTLSFTSDPNNINWTDQGKGIYMVRLDTGEVLARVEADPAGVTGPADMLYSIASSPAVLDLDFDGFADVVYIGDVGGQMWKWDISAIGVDSTLDGEIDNWPAGVFFRSYTSAAWSAGPSWYRQIFEAPAASFLKGELILAFGTGERADATFLGDPNSADENNRFYVIADDAPTGAFAFATVKYEDDLTDVTSLQSDNDPTDDGFFFVADDGEKFLTEHQIFAGFVITTTFEPDTTVNENVDCANRGGGDANFYTFDLETGLGFFADAASAGSMLRTLSVGSGFASTPSLSLTADGAEMFLQTSAGQVLKPPAPPLPGGRVFQIYWRQNF